MYAVGALHPAFLLRQNMRFSGVFMHALKRAVSLADKSWTPTWNEDELILKPSADTVVQVLKKMHGRDVTYDVETDGQHPIICQNRCISFYDGERGICVPFLYRNGKVEEYVDPESGRIKKRSVWVPYFAGDALKRVLQAIRELIKKARRFGTQNGQYDRTVLKFRNNLEFPAGMPHVDTILGHHIVAPYLKHGLGFLASMYTDAPYYKATDSGESWASESDRELWLYCARDTKVTWLVAKVMFGFGGGSVKLGGEIVELPQNAKLYEHDAWHEGQCQRWKETGVPIDREALAFFRQHYRTIAEKSLAAIKNIVGTQLKTGRGSEALDALLEKLTQKAEEFGEEGDVEEHLTADGSGRTAEFFNPASLAQLRLLLRHLGVPLKEQTATGELSTAREFLVGARKEMLTDGVPPTDPRIAFLDFLFAYRESKKLDSTYLYPEILNDGRVHATFNPFIVPTGRLSSKNPNLTNQPAEIRGMFVPPGQGHSIVYWDWDALEMRESAYDSGDPEFIKVFKEYDAKRGPKPHIVNMSVLFGLPATKEAAEQNPGMYRAAKVFAYLLAYGGGDTTAFEKMRDEMPDLQWKAFVAASTNYKKRYARLFAFQKETVAIASSRGWLETPVLKRRGFFFERGFGGEQSPEASAMQNFRAQGGGADIVSLANRRIVEQVLEPWRKRLKAGEELEQFAQIHDELPFFVPDRMVEEFKKVCKPITEEQQLPGWHLPVEMKSGKRWKPVQSRCPKCKDLIDVEPFKRDKKHVHWGGECKCGGKAVISVSRELEQ